MGRSFIVLAALLALAWPCAATAAASRRGPVLLANRCFALSSTALTGTRYVQPAGTGGYRVASRRARQALPLFLKPTALGRFMLYDRDGRLFVTGEGTSVARGAAPGPPAEWTIAQAGRRTTLRSTTTGRLLSVAAGTGALTTVERARAGRRERFAFRHLRRGCRRYPEAALGTKGKPFSGRLRDGTVLGLAEGHIHVTADFRAGGRVISGEAFNPFGLTEALGHDADVHGEDGSLDITGNLLRGEPGGTHDTHGYPSFAGWPVFDTNTHQQVYYRWLQRAWMGGLRLTVAQAIEDQPLCELEPIKSHSCDETETIKLEVERLRALKDYVDAQSGGRGRGWLELVFTPRQARRAIERGKLAVLIGVEASNPFGCSERMGQPQCDRAAIDRGIALYRELGIRSMFITHWVDNAFGGAAIEGGEKGTFIAAFQLKQTGHPFALGPCPEEGEGEEVAPLPGRRCNTKGLTDLGRYLVGRLMDEHMLIEADHLSEPTRRDVLAVAEARRYPLVSSHTNTGGVWVPSQLERLRKLGGYASASLDIAGRMGDRVTELRRAGFPGVGIGSDTGGFKALPEPDPDAARDPLRYPFRSYDGRVLFSRQRTGEKTFDVNADGVAHYGLVPDLLANVERRPGGREPSDALFHSAEAYLRTWELATRR